jgi:hypothetical protein
MLVDENIKINLQENISEVVSLPHITNTQAGNTTGKNTGNTVTTSTTNSDVSCNNSTKGSTDCHSSTSVSDDSDVTILNVETEKIQNINTIDVHVLDNDDLKYEDVHNTVQNNTHNNIHNNTHHTFNDEYYVNTAWNLTKLPTCSDSVLQHITTPITGVNVPWLYIGMLFSTFCWHTEDNYLFSMNYSHLGAGKQWYGIPQYDANKFEKVFSLKNITYRMCFMHSIYYVQFSSCFYYSVYQYDNCNKNI